MKFLLMWITVRMIGAPASFELLSLRAGVRLRLRSEKRSERERERETEFGLPPKSVMLYVSQRVHNLDLTNQLVLCPRSLWYKSYPMSSIYAWLTGWQFHLFKTSSWLQNKSSVLAWPGQEGQARLKRNLCFEVNKRFWTSGILTLYNTSG